LNSDALRTFTAKTMPEAMALVRDQLGIDAIILSTGRVNGGISVTAATDPAETASSREAAPADRATPEPVNDPFEDLHETLIAHGTRHRSSSGFSPPPSSGPRRTRSVPLPTGSRSVLLRAPERAAGQPAADAVGPPGAGKTVATAKLATRAVLAGRRPTVVSTDTVRAGGIAQLESFICMLGLELHRADSARQLTQLVAAAGASGPLLSTAPASTLQASDRGELAAYLRRGCRAGARAARRRRHLRFGRDRACFRRAGAKRLLTTRLDIGASLGSQLAAADAAQLSFCDASLASDIAKGLTPLNPVALARLLMPEATRAGAQLSPERTR